MTTQLSFCLVQFDISISERCSARLTALRMHRGAEGERRRRAGRESGEGEGEGKGVN